ncbi:MAG: hypothetical protein JRH20_05325 [Deltaproteobacteria bacterium]|nr:hypothetical protein [Deltaproteobacteria bacterium]
MPPPHHDGAPPPPPPEHLPDLVIQPLQPTISGSNNDRVRYVLLVCNQGTVVSKEARVDLYYHQLTAPTVGELGDRAISLPPLEPGACTSRRATWRPAPGTYSSWAQVDPKDVIAEIYEGNNLAGPLMVVVGTPPPPPPPPPLSCTQICGAALVCGLFAPLNFDECLSWCDPLSDAAHSCLSDAAWANDCPALGACAPLPTPPPLPPPAICDNICRWFVDSCNIAPFIDSALCLSICQNLPPQSLSCVRDAEAQNNCQAALGCLL